MATKIGRNHPCPCGSGFKYKHCHGAVCESQRRSLTPLNGDELPVEVQQKIAEMGRAAKEERAMFGHARPVVTTEMHGYRLVATGNRIEWSKNWKTMTDFLGDYIKKCIDPEWGNTEIAKPYEERHPILQWYNDLCEWQRRHKPGPDGIFSGVATGSVMAYYALAYDLWTLDNHALLQEKLINRLRNKDQFQGARYELYVVAALIRAGFEVELEDEEDLRRTHCELTATHPVTGESFSVEAKSTARPGMLGQAGAAPDPEEVRANVYRKLQAALLKEADHERIIFLDVNAPPHEGESLKAPWLPEAAGQLRRLEENQSKDDPFPAAYVFLTNHPYHYIGNDDVEPEKSILFTGINIDEFKQGKLKNEDAQARHDELMKARPAINQLVDSVFNHTKVPSKFPAT